MTKRTNLTNAELKEAYCKLMKLLSEYLENYRAYPDGNWQPVIDKLQEAIQEAEEQLKKAGIPLGSFDCED